MRGISEERLRELFEEYQHRFLSSQLEKMYEPHAVMNTLHALLDECQELSQWQPIDENTPKDRHVLLHISVGPIDCRNFVGNVHDSWPWKPTHWQELPPSPELPEQPK